VAVAVFVEVAGIVESMSAFVAVGGWWPWRSRSASVTDESKSG
jgi:hypothetical protein